MKPYSTQDLVLALESVYGKYWVLSEESTKCFKEGFKQGWEAAQQPDPTPAPAPPFVKKESWEVALERVYKDRTVSLGEITDFSQGYRDQAKSSTPVVKDVKRAYNLGAQEARRDKWVAQQPTPPILTPQQIHFEMALAAAYHGEVVGPETRLCFEKGYEFQRKVPQRIKFEEVNYVFGLAPYQVEAFRLGSHWGWDYRQKYEPKPVVPIAEVEPKVGETWRYSIDGSPVCETSVITELGEKTVVLSGYRVKYDSGQVVTPILDRSMIRFLERVEPKSTQVPKTFPGQYQIHNGTDWKNCTQAFWDQCLVHGIPTRTVY